jgi:hypothetical protein
VRVLYIVRGRVFQSVLCIVFCILSMSTGIHPTTLPRLRSRKQNTELNAQPQRWTKFTYTVKETRYITKLFKKFDIRVAFTTKNNIRHLLHNSQKEKHTTHITNVVYTLSLTSALDGVDDQRHAPAALPSGKIRYPLYSRLGWPQCRSGQVRKISPHRDSVPGPSSPTAFCE